MSVLTPQRDDGGEISFIAFEEGARGERKLRAIQGLLSTLPIVFPGLLSTYNNWFQPKPKSSSIIVTQREITAGNTTWTITFLASLQERVYFWDVS